MDEYAREITDLQHELQRLTEAEEDPITLADLELQLEVLQALYRQARQLYDKGLQDETLRRALSLRGYGDWSLDNVYAWVYESATDEPAEGPDDFLRIIRSTDFEWRLAAPLRA